MSSDFSVVAIIAAYNEADIIAHVVSDLVNQGIHVYFLDDGSTDCTVVAVEPYLGRGVLAIERLANPGTRDATHGFEWERILLRKTQLARELDADWFIHHDADEFRESPWSGLSLHDAIRRVDALGYNAIDFAGLDFWPVHDGFRDGDDVRHAFTLYAEPALYDRLQIRCWKKTADLDLASSGGHEARFAGRKVFPLRFILRHYPIRGQAHGERKVFHERRSRFSEQERDRGWHVQYDDVHEGTSFIRDPSTLTPYDPDAVRLALTLRHRGVETLEESLRDATTTLDTHRRDLDQCRQELARTHEELARTRAELSARSAEVATLHGVAARIADLAARNAEVAERSAEAAALRNALDERVDEIGRWRAAVADQTRRLDALHGSLSWRWTAPARAAYRLLRGR
ncbi:MAG: glycosyltransferase family 2 protein [Acidobacteria bacterium]|nr:glycosyltransferase family 2 protein [Acidobacteriota bacterium]